MAKRIAVLPGDGIGPEIMKAAIDVLLSALGKQSGEFHLEEAPVGGAAIDLTGTPLPEKTIQLCENSDAILFGSVGGPKWENLPPEKQPERGALLPLRKNFKLFANLRPVVLLPELSSMSPLKSDRIGSGVDILIVRELTGDVYFGQPKGREGSGENEKGYDTMVYHRYEIERIAEIAFRSAAKRKKNVTSIDKANVLSSMVLWREVVTGAAEKYNQHSKEKIEVNHLYVDNAAMQLILNPSSFDVMLCGNMFGDILSDEASVLGGSLGMLPSASLSEKEGFGLYEPSGGSAPDIAGKNLANPIAQILSSAMMLRYSFGMEEEAKKIEDAVKKAVKNGARTADIASAGEKTIGSSEMAQEIITQMK
ncbi:MAG: 3-isopropylmalate dehydrogenase [Spirochaetia bacterium]|nr:3-isopropylmalate dehydrogenase [Spirochaetia bacterium]